MVCFCYFFQKRFGHMKKLVYLCIEFKNNKQYDKEVTIEI
jgi:hypothetical protein